MDENLLRWLGTVTATFVGTGSAVLALRFLSGTLVGHWLAKGLAKYTAQVETEETRKRVAIERLDRERAQAIAAIMTALGDCASLVAYPPITSSQDKGGPEIAFLGRSREIQDIAQRVAIVAAKSSHLFHTSEEIVPLCLEWSSEATIFAHKYHDRIAELADRDGHWQLPWNERVTALLSGHDSVVVEVKSNKQLVDICRRLTAMP
jgi:hypothetical protein